MRLFGIEDMGIDLGTSTVLVYIRGKGVVLKEPAVVAYDRDTSEIKAIGEDARLMIGRTPSNIEAVYPMYKGVISNYTVTEQMLAYFIQKAQGRKSFKRPRICVSVPCTITEVEKRAVIDATLEAGAREVIIIEEPVAAALGAGIDISKACGNMIVDIGGGTTDIAVISLGDTVVSRTLKLAGNDFDQAIMNYLKERYQMLVGEQTAEQVKIKLGSAVGRDDIESMEVRGRDMQTGMPKTITVTAQEIAQTLKDIIVEILETVHTVLEETPPELASDIAGRGIILTGGGSKLYGMDDLIESTTKIRTIVVDDPASMVAIGTGRYAEFMEGRQQLTRG